MKTILCYSLILGLVILSRISAQAQTKMMTQVSVDLSGNTFTGTTGLPFDVPFKITGTVPITVKKITFQYRVKPSDYHFWMAENCNKCDAKKKCTDINWSPLLTWNNFALGDPAKDQSFSFTCDPLYPNINYEFQFKVYRSPSLTDVQLTALNKSLYDIIDKFVSGNDAGNIQTIEASLNTAYLTAAGPNQHVEKADGTVYVIKLTDDDLKTITDKLQAAHEQINIATTNLYGDVTTSKQDLRKLRNELGALVPALLNPASKSLLTSAVEPGNDDFQTSKFSELGMLVGNLNVDISQVLAGKNKIHGTALAVATDYDLPSIDLLRAFFKLFPDIKKADNTNYFSGDVLRAAHELSAAMDDAYTSITNLKAQQAIKTDALKTFPNLIINKYIYTSYLISDQSVMDVVSQNNAYIGLDYGMAYAFNYGQLFLYEGANIYFAPVNKDAPLSSIHGFWRNVAKRVSFHVGLTQNLITNYDKRYSPLLGSAGSLLAGAGVRFNRIMRINFGALVFQQTDVNPVVDNKTIQVRPAVSLTLDLNVAKALGGLGKSIGIQ